MIHKYCMALIFILLCSSSCSNISGFENYRYNPFQFPYSEYYLKADQISNIEIDNIKNEVEHLSVFGVDIKIGKNSFDEVLKNKNLSSPFVLKNKGKLVLLANYHEESLMGCNSQQSKDAHKDFCSAFSSSQEFNTKLFLLTPHDNNETRKLNDGDLWIIHRKGLVFEKTQKISIYQLENLTAFRQDLKENASGKIQIHIFKNSISPNSIEIILFEKNESLVDMILSSMNKN